MQSALEVMIRILRGADNFKMGLLELEKALAMEDVLGFGIEMNEVLKKSVSRNICIYDSEKNIVYLGHAHFRKPLHLLPKDDPRRRHLASDLPVCEIHWHKDMAIEEKKGETKNLISSIPGGYAYGLDADRILVAYSETRSSLSKFLTAKKFYRVCIHYKQIPGTVYVA